MDLAIEEVCIHLIWSKQPFAADLRVIGTALKAITDLERIADHAVNIAERVAFLLPGDYQHLAHSHVTDFTPTIS